MKLHTVDGVVRAALKLVQEKHWEPPKAIFHVYNRSELTPEEKERAVIKGLIALVNAERHSGRGGSETGHELDLKDGSRPVHPPRINYKAFFASIEYTGHDKPKAFLQFDLKDWASWTQDQWSKEYAYRVRGEFGELVQKLLRKHDAKTLEEVPDTVLREAYRAAKPWHKEGAA